MSRRTHSGKILSNISKNGVDCATEGAFSILVRYW